MKSTGVVKGPRGNRPRRPHLTGRAAILAVVVCAIVLSLAYPMREYLAQRHRIAELHAENQQMRQRIAALRERKQRLNDPAQIKRLARNRLHYVMPGQQNYIVIDGRDRPGKHEEGTPPDSRPWFVNLWSSVEEADGDGKR